MLSFIVSGGLPNSTYDRIYSNYSGPLVFSHNSTALSMLASTLVPGGILYIKEPVLPALRTSNDIPIIRTPKDLVSELKLAGFVDLEIKGAINIEVNDLVK